MNLILEARGLGKTFTRRDGLTKSVRLQALHDVSISLRTGEIIGIAGESGSGKSTLARCLASLEKPDNGVVLLEGRDIQSLPRPEAREVRTHVQLIFQDPVSSFNWNWTTADIIQEPLAINGIGTRSERRETALALMQDLGLSAEAASRSPLYLSGGQRQRVAIARALALRPKVLIFDESFSGLDLRIQSQIRTLLKGIREKWQLSYIIISHELGLLATFADYLYVMSRGRVVEEGKPRDLIDSPEHEQTAALVAAQRRLNLRLTHSEAGA